MHFLEILGCQSINQFSLNTTISPLIDGWQLVVICVRVCGVRAMLEVVVFVGLGCRRLVLSPPRARWLVDARCPYALSLGNLE